VPAKVGLIVGENTTAVGEDVGPALPCKRRELANRAFAGALFVIEVPRIVGINVVPNFVGDKDAPLFVGAPLFVVGAPLFVPLTVGDTEAALFVPLTVGDTEAALFVPLTVGDTDAPLFAPLFVGEPVTRTVGRALGPRTRWKPGLQKH